MTQHGSRCGFWRSQYGLIANDTIESLQPTQVLLAMAAHRRWDPTQPPTYTTRNYDEAAEDSMSDAHVNAVSDAYALINAAQERRGKPCLERVRPKPLRGLGASTPKPSGYKRTRAVSFKTETRPTEAALPPTGQALETPPNSSDITAENNQPRCCNLRRMEMTSTTMGQSAFRSKHAALRHSR